MPPWEAGFDPLPSAHLRTSAWWRNACSFSPRQRTCLSGPPPPTRPRCPERKAATRGPCLGRQASPSCRDGPERTRHTEMFLSRCWHSETCFPREAENKSGAIALTTPGAGRPERRGTRFFLQLES